MLDFFQQTERYPQKKQNLLKFPQGVTPLQTCLVSTLFVIFLRDVQLYNFKLIVL